jgi:hypothetical protein
MLKTGDAPADHVTGANLETTMRSLFAAVVVTLMLQAGPASALIRITDSRYESGTLIVAGQVKPNMKVTLDRKFSTSADSSGRFEFRVKHKPVSCMSDIATGEDTYSAVITNCLLGDAAANSTASASPASAGPAAATAK